MAGKAEGAGYSLSGKGGSAGRDIRQESFDRVWQHFVVERQPMSAEKYSDPEVDLDAYVRCLYNGPAGARCAFSLLLTDEERGRIRKESDSARRVIERHDLVRFEGHEDFFDDLQQCHDNAARGALKNGRDFYREVEQRLRGLASDYRLNVPAA